LQPNAKFVLIHYPRLWAWDSRVDSDNHWIPQPAQVPAIPGANGIKEPPKGQPVNIAPALAGHEASGATIIYPADRRLGPWYKYARFYPTKALTKSGQPGKFWVFLGQEAEILPPAESPVDVMWDDESAQSSWLGFCVHVRDEGIVQSMTSGVYRDIVGKLRQRRNQIASRAGQNPHFEAKVKVIDERLAGMERDFLAWRQELAADGHVEDTGESLSLRPRAATDDSEITREDVQNPEQAPAPKRRKKGAKK